MMYGRGWFGNYSCPFLGGNLFGAWHLLILLGVILIIAALIVWVRRNNRNSGNESQAIGTLKELYVKGEITEEEYLKRKNVIERK